MPNGITLPANIETARTKAGTAAATAGQYAAGQYTVGDIIKQKATEAYKASQDIIKPLDVATQEYLQAPQVAREKYQDVFDPFAREKLVGQYTGTQALPMLSLSSILGQRFGRIEDIIGAGTRAYQAQGAQAGTQAQLERQTYTDLLNQYQIQQQQEQQAWQRPWQEKLWEYQLGKPYYKKETGGGGTGDIIGTLCQLAPHLDICRGISGAGAAMPTEPKPTVIPTRTDVNYSSPRGEWMWDPETQDWYPVGD